MGKPNPFVKFALMRKKQCEAEGVAFPEGLKSAVAMFGPEWQKMDATERLCFKANGANPSAPNPNADIGRINWKQMKTTHGLQLGDLMEEATKTQYLEECRRISTTNIFMPRKEGDLPLPEDQEFVIIEFTMYSDKPLPAEVALTAFSLRRGVLDNYSTLIDPVKIPMGYTFEVKVAAKALGVPLPDFGNDCDDYKQILRNIDRFLKQHPTEESPVRLTNLYCLRNEHKKVRGCLKWLADKCGVKREYHLSSLGLMLQQFGLYGKRNYLRHLEMMETLKKTTEMMKALAEAEQEGSEEYESIACTVTTSCTSTKYGEGIDPSISPCYPGFPIQDGRTRARRLPHTSVHQLIAKPIYKFRAGTKYDSSAPLDVGTDSRYWGTPDYGDDPMYCMAERVPGGPQPDSELFMFEKSGDDYLDSLDLAFCMELCCSHHTANGIGAQFCALNVVNRYAYNILDILLGYFPTIFPIEGAHYPLLDPVKEATKRRNILFCWGRDGYTDLEGYRDSKPKIKPLGDMRRSQYAAYLKEKEKRILESDVDGLVASIMATI